MTKSEQDLRVQVDTLTAEIKRLHALMEQLLITSIGSAQKGGAGGTGAGGAGGTGTGGAGGAGGDKLNA